MNRFLNWLYIFPLVIGIACIILFLGRDLNPLSPTMFLFHDNSQIVRISEFAFNIKNGQIPPRLAPHFENNMGYAAFNFYGPFSYWIAAFFFLGGVSIFDSLKLAFLLALIAAFIGMFALSSQFFSKISSLAASALYITGVYFAIDIFVRGNLAETWYMSVFPLTLFFLIKNPVSKSRLIFIGAVLSLAAVFTVHTVFAPASLLVFVILIFLQKKRAINLVALLFALAMASYFILPALIEGPLTYAKASALQTNYKDHFLCAGQLWNSAWGYAGSAPGCAADGMSFMLGKLQILIGGLGIVLFLYSVWMSKKRSDFRIPIFFFLLGLTAIFLTLYQSEIAWSLLSRILSVFQFPWRFLTFATFFLAFFSGYFFDFVYQKIPIKIVGAFIIIGISFATLFMNAKFFKGQSLPIAAYSRIYYSQNYIHTQVAHVMPEYFPKVGDFDFWKTHPTPELNIPFLENGPYEKKFRVSEASAVPLPILYFPYWKIKVNETPYIPNEFEPSGRPIVRFDGKATVDIKFEQTNIEKVGNAISILSLFLLLGVVLYTNTWRKLKKTQI